MKTLPSDRLAAAIGCVLAGVVCVWWLGATRLALDHGRDPVRLASDALQALVIARALAIVVIAARVSTTSSWARSMRAGVLLVVQGWPVVLLAWSASAVAVSRVIATEGMLVVAAAVTAAVGVGVRHGVRRSELALMVNTLAGLVLAAAFWSLPALWRMPAS